MNERNLQRAEDYEPQAIRPRIKIRYSTHTTQMIKKFGISQHKISCLQGIEAAKAWSIL